MTSNVTSELRYCESCHKITRWFTFDASQYLACIDCGDRWRYAADGFGIVRTYTNVYT